MIGKWFKLHPERRKDIFLASKFGLKATSSGIVADSSPEHFQECIRRSLSRLGVECIDLYYVHRVDPAVPIEKTIAVMAELVRYVVEARFAAENCVLTRLAFIQAGQGQIPGPL